ncbi:MAG: DegT/DnrJ/EryC1/StrS family aminotransferase [Balneolaceae bacterium]
MSKKNYSRREFIKSNSFAGAGAFLSMGVAPSLLARDISQTDEPAILGGKAVRTADWPSWPRWNRETDEERVLDVIRSGVWSRSETVTEFEKTWAETVGAKRCLTTVNGTNALICALANLDVGGGDEVIIPPYTFIACPQSVLQNGAMPVFVDTDPETFQMDAEKIEEKITPRTRAIMPVHLAGCPSDMVRIMDIARRHDLVVVEDACQAWLAEINNKQVGTFGDAGCYSFQNSKNIPMGEGGAIVSDDEEFIDRCYAYHNFGRAYGTVPGSGFVMSGTKMRLAEYQAAIGLAQLKRFEEQTDIRIGNAEYLKSQMQDIPGILPYKLYDNVTRVAFHLFPFRYRKEAFEGLSREDFRRALRAEGVPSSSGYTTLNKLSYLNHAFQTKSFQKMYPEDMLDFDRFMEKNHCPENDRLCNEEAVWFFQSMLLGDRSDMDNIIEAIGKIQKNAGRIKSQLEA